jgi:hypothetical protein
MGFLQAAVGCVASTPGVTKRGRPAALALVATMLLCPHSEATVRAAAPTPSEPAAAALATVSATLGQVDASYRVESSARGLHAINPAQRTDATFTPSGVTLRAGRERLTIRFSAYGRGEALQPALGVAPVAEANRTEYRRGALTEWYSNGPFGLEQGFTLAARPDGPAAAPLRLVLSVSGMTAAAASNSGPVAFSGRDGRPLLRCAELSAADALGRPLPARIELRGHRLTLVVDDTEARYPVTVDPTYSQIALLTAGRAGGLMGTSVAVDNQNQTLVAAAPGNLSSVSGYAYVFVKQPAGQWSLATQLENPDVETASVAISGDGKTIVVGSCSLANCIGHAFVYSIPGAVGGWASAVTMLPTATLSAPNGQVGDRIGQAVAIDFSGDTVAFGAPCDTTAGAVLCGSAFVFVQPPSSSWASSNQPTAQLTFNLPSGAAVDSLGFSVAMDAFGDTIVVGAPGVQAAGANQGNGTAYVFVRPSSTLGSWTTTSTAAAVLKQALGGDNGDAFGRSVAIDFGGDAIAIGAPLNPNSCAPQPCFAPGPGAAYVFVKPTSAGGWADAPNPKSQDATLTAAVGAVANNLGGSVSIATSGATVIAGARDGAYVFNMPPAGWSNGSAHEDQKLTPSTGLDESGNPVTPTAGFASVFVSPDASLVAAGNPSATVGTNASEGAVLVFAPSVCAVLTPTSYTFDPSPQFKPTTFTFTLANTCNSQLENIAASIVGPYQGDFGVGQGNGIPCGRTLAANSSCNFTVTFIPTYVTNTETATLTISDVDAHSPQQAALAGIGAVSDADFAVAPTSASPASGGSNCTPPSDTSGSCSATVTAGSSAVFSFRFTALNGFSAGVEFNVTSDLPAEATPIVVSASSVYPSVTGSDITVTVPTTTTAPTAAAQSTQHGFRVSEVASFAIIPSSLSMLALGWRSRSRSRKRPHRSTRLAILAVLIAGVGLASCDENGGASSFVPPPPQLPPVARGTYTLTLGANPRGEYPAAGAHYATVTLVVQ